MIFVEIAAIVAITVLAWRFVPPTAKALFESWQEWRRDVRQRRLLKDKEGLVKLLMLDKDLAREVRNQIDEGLQDDEKS